MADLKVAVERISEESSSHDAAQSRRDIEGCLVSIDRLRRERAVFREKMVDARKTEVAHIDFAGYRGSKARIAEQCSTDADMYGWVDVSLGNERDRELIRRMLAT
jgi:hypothetical protein